MTPGRRTAAPRPARDASASASALRTLLDPPQVAAILRAHVRLDGRPLAPRRVRIERCWPAGHGLRVCWSFTIRGRAASTLCALPARPADLNPRPSGPPTLINPPELRGVRVPVPRFGVVIVSPDCDPALPQLATLLNPVAMRARLQRACRPLAAAGRPVGARLGCRLLGYKPGRRAAIRYEWFNGRTTLRVLGKLHHDRRGQRLISLHRRVQQRLDELSGGRVRVPQPIAYLRDLRLALFEWADGGSAADGLGVDGRRLRAALDALAVLHQVELDDLRPFTLEDECAVVRRWFGVLGRVEPPRAAQVEPLVDALLRWSRRIEPGLRRTIHRDFYEKQLVWNGSTTTVLDLDTLARGDACQDLGNLLSHAYLHRLQAGESTPGFARLAEQLLAHYERRLGRVPRETVAFYCASSLIRGGCLHSLRTATRRYALPMWRHAAAILRKQGATATAARSQARAVAPPTSRVARAV